MDLLLLKTEDFYVIIYAGNILVSRLNNNKLVLEYVLTCDAAYLICKLSNTITNTTYED